MKFHIVIGCVLLFSQTLSCASIKSCEQRQCLAVIDAGSTGSRLHVYSFDKDQTNTPINITEEWSNKIKPGFATVEAKPEAVNRYLSQLFNDAPVQVPTYFYATAGMRLLSQPQQQELYEMVKGWFNQSQHTLLSARTITGEEEGVFDWLAVNYGLGSLQTGRELVGTLDIGGASIQISFPLSKNQQAADSQKRVTVFGRNYELFTHSFLGLGQTETTHQFLDSEQCFVTNYKMPSGKLAKGNAYQCEEAVSSLLNSVHQVSDTVQPFIKENPVGEWYVLGGINNLLTSEPFSSSKNTFSAQELLDKAQSDVCQQNWVSLTAKYQNDTYLYGYCLFPSYYYALIVNGYGIQPEKTLHATTEHQIQDWTVGVVLLSHQKENHDFLR